MAPPPPKRKRLDKPGYDDSERSTQRSAPHSHQSGDMPNNYGGHPSYYGRGDNRAVTNPSRGAYDARRPGRGGRAARGSGRGRGGNSMNSSAPSRPQNSPQGATADERPTSANAQGTRTAESMDGVVPAPPQPASSTTPAPRTQPIPPAPRPPPPSKTNREYQTLTTEVVQDWDSTGRQTVVEQWQQIAAAEDISQAGELFMELIDSGLDQRIGPTEAGKTVQLLLENHTPEGFVEDARLIFLDILCVLPDSDCAHPYMVQLISATGISFDLMRTVLDEPQLRALGLVRETFGKMFIRKQTQAIYRQSNYNLLREESEGWSKLMTELHTVASQDDLPEGIEDQTLKNIFALIGTFDLDAGRALDVILDVFANMLVKKDRFFVKLLRASPYWPQPSSGVGIDDPHGFILPLWASPDHPACELTTHESTQLVECRLQRDIAFWNDARTSQIKAWFRLGGRKVADDAYMIDETSPDLQSLSQNQVSDAQWIRATGTNPPSGSYVAAQLLGQKLRHYAESPLSKDDELPTNLMRMTALLIKIGFISLRDLYPHLSPSDEDMPAVKAQQTKKNEEQERTKRPGGGEQNALARAGALVDDTLPPSQQARLRAAETRSGTPSRTEETQSAKDGGPTGASQEPHNQKVELLKSLMLLGAIPDVLFMLSQFPWLIDAFPEVADYNNRILHHSLSDVYSSIDPTSKTSVFEAESNDLAVVPSANQSALPKGKIRLTSLSNPQPQRWMDRDERDASGQESGNLPMQFFWEDWVNDVPLCQTIDDVFTLCDTYLNVSGVKIGRDPLLVSKLARIGKHSLSEDRSEMNKARWAVLLKRIICPALSLTQANAGVTEDVWNLLKLYDAEARFSIYAEWFQGQTSRLVDVASAFGTTRAWTKHVLKRISKDDDLKKVGRELGKLTYSSPGVAFEVCLNQIESYDNMIGVVVECGQFISSMAFDVLPFTIMSFLGRQGRSRVSHTGFTANKWLQSLSTFIGQVYARHNLMEPVLILRYILDQVRRNSFPDLRILRDLVSNMAGITPDNNFSQSQLVNMGGGDFLRRLTLEMLDDTRYAREKSGRRLMYHLKHYNLAGPLMIAVSRLRQTGVFTQDIDDIKILGETIDEALTVQAQFVQLLNHYLEPIDFDKQVRSVGELVSGFGLSVDMAFTIHRKSLTQKMIQYDTEHKSSSTKAAKPSDPIVHAADGEVKMPDWDEKGATENGTASSSDGKPLAHDDTVIKAAVDDEAAAASGTSAVSEVVQPWHPVLEEVMAALEPSLSEEVKSCTGVHFLTTFWQLDLPAISPTPKTYEKTIAQKKAAMQKSLPNTRDTNERFKVEAEKKKAKDDHDRLVSEANTHFEKMFKPTRYRLRREKDHWFKGFQNKAEELHMSLLQDCFIPRVCLSAVDAVFAYKMLFEMHSLGTPNFRTGKLLGNLFNQRGLTNLIFQFTHKQADNFGHFLFGVLEILGEWHKDRDTFEMRAHGGAKDLPGFASRISPTGKPENFLEYEEFRRALRRWHNNLFMALKSCLSSPEYMSVRNGIQLITRILNVFPAIEYMGNGLTKELTTIADREKGKRDDLSVAARSAYGQLKSQQKRWMSVQDFSINEPGQQNAVTPQASKDSTDPEGGSKPELAAQAQSDEGAGQLRPTAPDFKPEERTRAGNEDGEIRDVKMTDADDASKMNSLPASSKGSEAATSERESKLPASPRPRTVGRGEGRSDGAPRASNALKRPSTDASIDNGESPSSNKRFRGDDYGHDSRHDPAAPPRLRAVERGADRASLRRSGNYHQSDGGDARGMPPPSMPKSDRPPPRGPDAPAGHRVDQMGYGRSSHDHSVSHGSSDYSHSRQNRHEYPPPGPDRRHSGSNAQVLTHPDRADTPGRSGRPTRGPDPRRSESASAPSTPSSESNAIPLGRPNHMDPMTAPRPPPSQATRTPSAIDQSGFPPRRQEQGRLGGPPGLSNNQRSSGPYNTPPARLQPDAPQSQYDDYPSGRNTRSNGPPASPVDPQGPAVNPARAALIQDNGVPGGGRASREDGRYGPDSARPQQRRGSPNRSMPPGDFGGGMRPRNGGMPPDGAPHRHHREERPDLISRSDANMARRDDRMREERPDLIGRNEGGNGRRDDRNRGREDYEMDTRAAPYQRESSRDTRGPAEPSRAPRGNSGYDEPPPRGGGGGELPPRRNGPPRDLISHAPITMHDSDRPPVRERDIGAREIGARDRRVVDDRGLYSRPEDSAPPRGGLRGGPPPRRGGGGGGPGASLDSRIDTRSRESFGDPRAEPRRSGDFQGGPRGERRDAMNGGGGGGGGGGSERRKRTWGERNEDEMGGEAKRPTRR